MFMDDFLERWAHDFLYRLRVAHRIGESLSEFLQIGIAFSDPFEQRRTLQQLYVHIHRSFGLLPEAVVPGFEVVNPGADAKKIEAFVFYLEGSSPAVVVLMLHFEYRPRFARFMPEEDLRPDVVMTVAENVSGNFHHLAYREFGGIAATVYLW